MRYLFLILILAFSLPAAAFQNEKALDNPGAEAKAQKLFKEIRCLVCEGESLSESNADLAVNMRGVIREMVAAGESDKQIRQYLVWHYGNSILQKPPFSVQTYLLWLFPAILLLIGIFAISRMIYLSKHGIKPSSLKTHFIPVSHTG